MRSQERKLSSLPRSNVQRYYYVLTPIVVSLIYVVCYRNKWQDDNYNIQMTMLAALLTIGCYTIIQGYKNKLSTNQIIGTLILAGFVMRIGYMIYTHPYVRYHDVCGFASDSTGHDGYIYNLIHSFKLPESNSYQGYHPPFYHILSALFIKLTTPLVGYEELAGAQVISCVASCYSLLVIRRIIEELKLGEQAKLITMSIMAFFPSFYLIGGTINNDAVMWCLFFIAILYTIRWYQNTTYHNIMILAVAIGLGMMTKVSAGTIALFTGPIMLAVLVKKIREANRRKWVEIIKENQVRKVIGQFFTFGVICFPLALWYPIRNYILFNQAFMHVSEMPPTHELYVGHISKISRFLSFPLSAFTNNMYSVPVDDYNLPTYVIKGGVFGEYSFDIPDFIPALLLFVNVILVLLSIYAMLSLLIKDKEKPNILRYGIISIWFILFVSFILFNLRYPFGCTMDYRYIVPCAMCGAIALGVLYENKKKEVSVIDMLLRKAIAIFTAAFCVLSVVMYLNIA